MKGADPYRSCLSGLLVLLSLFFCTDVRSDLLQQKSYIVRSDRNQDILCEPYIVRKNDWVYKLFRQKGEISNRDFPEFLAIFKRLNPHVRNINTIRPGQTILIPLKKMDYGSLPGQADGVVTIPFVTISKVSDILHQYASKQKIKRGDTLYGIMSRQFAPFGSKAFQRGMKLLLSLNADITNPDRIYAGQTIQVPDMAITRQSWYASLFDESGELKSKISLNAPLGPPPDPQDPLALSAKETDSLDPDQKKDERPVSDLEKAARIVSARLRNRGSYYFPTHGGDDFQLDLSQFPLIELKNGRHIIFQDKEILFKTDLDKIRSSWPDVEVLSGARHFSLRQFLDLFLSRQKDLYEDNHLSFTDQGMDITIHANWITRSPSFNNNGQDRLCITLLENNDERTPPAIVRYLAGHHILLKEIVYPKTTEPTHILPESQNKSSVTQKLADVDAPDSRTFVKDLIISLGFSYASDTSITFPYAGIQVEARSNLVSSTDGPLMLVDFCDLYGDAISAIRQSGLDIVQLKPDDTTDMLLQKILTALSIPFQTRPIFLAAKRPKAFNTAITLPGHLIQNGQSKILFSTLDLNKNIAQFLQENGISVTHYRPIN